MMDEKLGELMMKWNETMLFTSTASVFIYLWKRCICSCLVANPFLVLGSVADSVDFALVTIILGVDIFLASILS